MTNEELRAAATEVMIAIVASNVQDPLIRRKEECLYEVLRQWLEEHPVDDEDGFTDEWLKLLGFHEWKHGGLVIEFDFYSHGCLFNIEDDGSTMFIHGGRDKGDQWNEMPFLVDTRGDVRRLCKALGIELKGDGNASI